MDPNQHLKPESQTSVWTLNPPGCSCGGSGFGLCPAGLAILPAASCKLDPRSETNGVRLLAHPLLVTAGLFPAPRAFRNALGFSPARFVTRTEVRGAACAVQAVRFSYRGQRNIINYQRRSPRPTSRAGGLEPGGTQEERPGKPKPQPLLKHPLTLPIHQMILCEHTVKTTYTSIYIKTNVY